MSGRAGTRQLDLTEPSTITRRTDGDDDEFDDAPTRRLELCCDRDIHIDDQLHDWEAYDFQWIARLVEETSRVRKGARRAQRSRQLETSSRSVDICRRRRAESLELVRTRWDRDAVALSDGGALVVLHESLHPCTLRVERSRESIPAKGGL